jgi:ABC-type transport system involved in multi-copper enzyme maturation permease subunit
MSSRWGLGPVFAFEWLTITRRWQLYAMRAGFVAIILAGMAMMWSAQEDVLNSSRDFVTFAELARVGQALYGVIVGIEITLVLLAAPAATAGSVCLDKARGSLIQVLATDLSNAEIVLGKLAVRLAPVVGMICCVLPVMAVGTLLGGLDPEALFGSFLVALGIAVLGCTLAFTLSVWGRKTHEVLLATYLVLILWIASAPAAWIVMMTAGFLVPVVDGSWWWLKWGNPFYLVFAPYSDPGAVDLSTFACFLLACLTISAGMACLSIARIRAVVIQQAGRAAAIPKPLFGLGRCVKPHWFPTLPGPSLDLNPVLWREWHRSRPSRWMRVVWGVYIIIGVFIAFTAVMQLLQPAKFGPRLELAAICIAFQVVVGLLLLSIAAATSLSEERVRGSLDILLSTPLSTLSILVGKWSGSFRLVPWLAILPAFGGFLLCLSSEKWIRLMLYLGLITAFGAVITSIGLALATWVKRQGRALGLCVSTYVLFSIGLVFVAIMLDRPGHGLGPGLAVGSPIYGSILGLMALHEDQYLPAGDFREWVGVWVFMWLIVHTLAGVLLFGATWATFDRCLGRISEASFSEQVRSSLATKIGKGKSKAQKDWAELWDG